ncbi:MAG TPA: non-homologous end-joining DNA ligase [Puia sp.]|nr:non-homologous end-joining DNA ligase [Puia sp.]
MAERTTRKQTGTPKKNKPSSSPFAVDTEKLMLVIDKKELSFTNLSKIYWPAEKLTKRDVLNYYYEVASFIMPYLKDRPQSLNRHPNGIKGLSFFQKDVTGKVAPWVTTYKYLSESDGEMKEFLVCADEAALLYMANLGCIEMNPWHSRIQSPDNPDWCVIDLDPDNNSYDEVMEVAKVVKKVLDSVRIPCYCKTSGSTGMHIYIPLAAAYSYDQSRLFAELTVNLVHNELPDLTSVIRNPSKRKRKIYLDFLQNHSTQTIAAPYSLRPKPGAPVSTPLHWDELKKGLKIKDFSIFNTMDRLKIQGDIFKPVIGKGCNLEKAIEDIKKL